jgi:hypothetical protein
MQNRIRIVFLLLILFQGLHSIEEYYGTLWDVLSPARMLSGAVSSDLRAGFIIINAGLFIFGILCWFISTRRKSISFQGFIWIWVIIEIINGIGHTLLALRQNDYFPGLYTAPVLLGLALYLARLLWVYSRNHKFEERTGDRH